MLTNHCFQRRSRACPMFFWAASCQVKQNLTAWKQSSSLIKLSVAIPAKNCLECGFSELWRACNVLWSWKTWKLDITLTWEEFLRLGSWAQTKNAEENLATYHGDWNSCFHVRNDTCRQLVVAMTTQTAIVDSIRSSIIYVYANGFFLNCRDIIYLCVTEAHLSLLSILQNI